MRGCCALIAGRSVPVVHPATSVWPSESMAIAGEKAPGFRIGPAVMGAGLPVPDSARDALPRMAENTRLEPDAFSFVTKTLEHPGPVQRCVDAPGVAGNVGS